MHFYFPALSSVTGNHLARVFMLNCKARFKSPKKYINFIHIKYCLFKT